MKKITVLLTTALVFAAIASIPTTTASAAVDTASATPLATPEKRLNNEEVGALLDDLQDGLSNQITDAEVIDAIGEKWDAHKGLVGKTRNQVLTLLMADVRSVIADKGVRDAIWASWTEGDNDDDNGAGAPSSQPDTRSDQWLKLVHSGFYMAHFDVTWDELGKPGQKFRARNKSQGYQETLNFPGGTRNIRVHIANQTGLAWEPTHDVINRSITQAEMNKCLVIDGTTMKAGMRFETCDTSPDEGASAPARMNTETWIRLAHNGAYIAHFDVTWSEPGKPDQTFHADKSSGYNETLEFPRGASNIRVKITNDTGLNWEPSRQIINRSLTSAEMNKCLVVDGTALGSRMRFENCDPEAE